ncbi:aminotransferase class III-fold pyridoxal phosphate-dependent enzyme [Trinickia fusca]|uniref:Aminotransferase class III-fold pyridoxal phosphate-dependent enzyme n=1 Tax=Trinickia fusca TaxID=2419777 RepID=A0A494XCJ9_9BURK|nr:aminotransferase class III-fold pyridoxal phosphate-dependent enzyme [Trinickia fusca]RKP45283.1 aminotransferase class III-fold pyridoxal phosphate-dependent enzyme [Trinickia fusca]
MADFASNDIVGKIVEHIVRELAHSLRQAPHDLDPERLFVDMGADSLILAETLQDINRRYKVSLSVGEMYESVNTIAKVAQYIFEHGQYEPVLRAVLAPVDVAAPVVRAQTQAPRAHTEFQAHQMPLTPAPAPLPAALPSGLALADASTVEDIVRRQLELMERQLALLGAAPSEIGQDQSPAQAHTPMPAQQPVDAAPASVAAKPAGHPTPAAPSESSSSTDRFSAFSVRLEADQRKDDTRKLAHIEALTERHNARTSTSKRMAQTYRRVLADNRVSAGFRPLLKELVYPVLAETAEGAHLVDVDGNRYIDFTMGFGVHLFGHAPSFVVERVRAQIERGMAIGPQSPMAGRVAELIAEFTGHERVVFCNSGTEATMTAVRLARLAAGRDKLVVFKNSYHGSFDAFLARSAAQGATRPASPGTPESLVADTIVLDYCEPSSLDYLEAHADEIGVVMVEPVQSRAPSMRPGPFLAKLRELTRAHGIVLVFDEVISGFRCARGGAQEYFGVRADMCTYGKVAGGGMPIGLVAGSAACMDGIDGGWWQFGDDSYPAKPTIFFAGTFSKHPLTMAASLAVLDYLKDADLSLYERLNEATRVLAERLIAVFEEAGVDVTIEQFSSLFRFTSKGNLDLFFYHLLANGIYIWEGRNCFVSTAHTPADLDRLVDTVRDICKTLAPLGLVPVREQRSAETSAATGKADPQPHTLKQPQQQRRSRLPLSDAQQRFFALEGARPEGRIANNVCFGFRFDEPVDAERLAAAVEATIGAHDALGARIDLASASQTLGKAHDLTVERIAHDETLSAERAVELAESEQARPLELENGQNVRVTLHTFADAHALLVISLHHLACDGWSLGVLLKEIGLRFNGEPVLPSSSYADWIAQEDEYRASDRYVADQAYWRSAIEQVAAYRTAHVTAPVQHDDRVAPRPGARASVTFDAALSTAIAARAKRSGTTTFTWLLTCMQLFLSRVYRGRSPVVALPFGNRTSKLRDLVGNCVNLPVLVPMHGEGLVFDDVLAATRTAMSELMNHSRFPYHELCELYRAQTAQQGERPAEITFNVEPLTDMPAFGTAVPELVAPVNHWIEFDLMFNVFMLPGGMRIELDYNAERFTAQESYGWLYLLAKVIENEANAAQPSALTA